MMGTQDKCLGVADDDVQPMEKAGMGIVGFVFMDIAFQRRDVTAIAIAVDLAAIVKSGMVNFFTYACLILSVTRIFRKRGLPHSSNDSATKPSPFLCPAPAFSLLFSLNHAALALSYAANGQPATYTHRRPAPTPLPHRPAAKLRRTPPAILPGH